MSDTQEFGTLLVYTTRQGGLMRHVRWASMETYEEAKRTGRLNLTPDQDEPTWLELKMVAFATVEELHDFVLEPVAAAA